MKTKDLVLLILGSAAIAATLFFSFREHSLRTAWYAVAVFVFCYFLFNGLRKIQYAIESKK